MLSEKQTRSLCQKLLSFVTAEDAEVSVTSQDFSHLRFAANDFTTSGRREDGSAHVTVWIKKKQGSASANDLDDASLRGAVEQAEQIARLAPEDKEYLPTLGAQKYKPSSDYVEATANLSLASRARSIDEIIRSCEKNNLIGAGFHHARGSASGSATKNGNYYFHRSSLASLSVTARTPDGGSSGYFLRNHFDIAKLNTRHIGEQAIQKALRSKDPRLLEPGAYPVILEAQAADDLIRFSFDARSADEG